MGKRREFKKKSLLLKKLLRIKRLTPSIIVDSIDVLLRLKSGIKCKYTFTSKNEQYNPFFIIGAGRSGNTLLRKLLVEKTDVIIPPEIPAFGNIIRKFNQICSKDWEILVDELVEYFKYQVDIDIPTKDINNNKYIYNLSNELNIDFEKLKKELLYVDNEEKSLDVFFNKLYSQYSINNYGRVLPWGDKTPWNVFHLERILKVYPNAKFIHMLRDGRDSVASYVKSLGSERGISYEDAAYRWKDSINKIKKVEKKHKRQFYELRYEELVSNPDNVMEEIINFLELEYKEDIKNDLSKMGDTKLAHHINLSKPINKDSIGKWKKDIPSDIIDKIEQIIDKELKLTSYKY